MSFLKRVSPSCRSSLILLLALCAAYPVFGQADAPPRASFFPYRCEYQPTNNTAQIRAVLMGADGLPLPADAYTLTVAPLQNGGALPEGQITVTQAPQRLPLRIILVLDITDTVPISEIVNAISTRLAPRLGVQDELALITVGSQISPLTQFYMDKNRLINEHMLDLRQQEGDNQIYDAVLAAVTAFEPANSAREVVLLVTDSGRRATTQVPTDDIIANAQANGVQIFNIGYEYEDRPDVDELRRISDATHGYTWMYDGAERSRIAIGGAVGDSLDRFINALNTEVLINVNLRGVEPDGVAGDQQRVQGGEFTIVAPETVSADQPTVALNLTVDTANDDLLSGSIVCPVEILSHAITLRGLEDNAVFTSPADIEVDVQSDMALTEARIVFWLNDAIVQDSSSTRYTFNAPLVQPGPYTLRAQLRDVDGEVLASTRSLTIHAKQMIELRTVDNVASDLNGIVRFEASVSERLTLPDVQFRIGTASNPGITVPLGAGTAPVRSGGSAILTVNDIQAEIDRLFPNERGRAFEVSAFIPGASPSDPLLAESNVLPISLPAPDAPQTAIRVPPFLETILRSPWTVPIGTTFALLLLNILLLRNIGRVRVLRLINRPDDTDLSDRLMTITVRRNGTRKSHILTKKTMNVGRGSQNDINLGDDATISRQHGVVMWRRNNWYYANRKRGSKTRINGRKLRGIRMIKLEPITEIDIGEAHLIFHSNAQQDIAELTKTNL